MPFFRHTLICCAIFSTTAVGASPVSKTLRYLRATKDRCQNFLEKHTTGEWTVPPALRHEPAIKRYDLFLPLYQPWTNDGSTLVGRREHAEWRIDSINRRMSYETLDTAGGVARLANIRRIAAVALERVKKGADLADYSTYVTDHGTLIVDLPIDNEGMDFVIGLENVGADQKFLKAFAPRQMTLAQRELVMNWLDVQLAGQRYFKSNPDDILRMNPRPMDHAVAEYRQRQSDEHLPAELLGLKTVRASRVFFAALGPWRQVGKQWVADPNGRLALTIDPASSALTMRVPSLDLTHVFEAALTVVRKNETLKNFAASGAGQNVRVTVPLDRRGVTFLAVIRARVVEGQSGELRQLPPVTDAAEARVDEWLRQSHVVPQNLTIVRDAAE